MARQGDARQGDVEAGRSDEERSAHEPESQPDAVRWQADDLRRLLAGGHAREVNPFLSGLLAGAPIALVRMPVHLRPAQVELLQLRDARDQRHQVPRRAETDMPSTGGNFSIS